MTDEPNNTIEYWLEELDRSIATYTAGGMNTSAAAKAAYRDIYIRRTLANKTCTWTFPGAMIEDVDGNPIGMEPNLSETISYGPDGRGHGVFADPEIQP